MVDLKQLNHFLVSADVSSFSEAAKILYTTQSNISKAILALEKNLGVKLFYREARGISLTPQGRNIYHHARRILDGMDELENMTNTVEADWLNISSNPSSWFARRFAEFYNEHYEENLHCRVQNAGVSSWKTNCNKEFTIENMDVSVVTNSDYIMETMLTDSPMANLSGSYFSPDDGSAVKKGIPLQMDDGEAILFGMVRREGEELSPMAEQFAEHIRASLQTASESDIVELE